MSLQQLQNENQLQEAHERCNELQTQVDQLLQQRKHALENAKEEGAKTRAEINALEQQLIQAKLEAATVKTQLQEEKNRNKKITEEQQKVIVEN